MYLYIYYISIRVHKPTLRGNDDSRDRWNPLHLVAAVFFVQFHDKVASQASDCIYIWYMTTWSGLTYKAELGEKSQQPSAVSVGDLLKILAECQQRQAEAEERQRVAEEEERRRRLMDGQRRQEESERQMALIAMDAGY